MASAKDRVDPSRRKKNQPPNANKTHLVLDLMALVDETRNKIDLVFQEFLLGYHEIQLQESPVIVISQEQLQLYKKLSMQRIQNKIDLEAYQHKQKMKLLEDFSWLTNS